MGQFDLDKLLNDKKKNGMTASFEKVQREKEVLKEMEGLGLNAEEYNDFLEKRDSYRPTLYDVNRVLDDLLVAEYTARMSCFAAFILADQNIYLSGLSGSGKTKIADATLSLVLPGFIVKIESGSEKNLLERKRDMEKCKWVILTELNKVDSALTIEWMKSAAEQKTLSYDRGGAKPLHIELPPKPWLVTRATESATTNMIGTEIMSRVVEIETDSSEKQTMNILDRKAEGYKYPFRVNKIDNVYKACLRWHISQLPEIDVYINAAADLLTDIIPTTFVSSRRRFDNYINVCAGITKMYWKDRIIGEIDGKSVIFTTPSDIIEAHIVFGQHLVDAALQITPDQKLIMKVILENGGRTKQEIQKHLREYSLNLSITSINTHVTHLTDYGYLDIDKSSKEHVYFATDFFKRFELKPNMNKIVECMKNTMLSEPDYKLFADEYIERFCNPDNMNFVNPFTGECENVLTYKFENVFGIEEGSTRMKEKEIIKEVLNKNKSATLNQWF